MLKKINSIIMLFAMLTTSCQESNSTAISTQSGNENQKAVVKEVIQTTSYTYLRVEKNNEDLWLAVIKQDYTEGAFIYYTGGLKMTNFESPELKRTFETVYFVQNISNSPIDLNTSMNMPDSHSKKAALKKLDIQISQPAGAVSIGELYEKRETYSGKPVKVRGQVTKVNTTIMGRNWIHIQDGTSSGESFDLTLTTDHQPKEGDVVTYSGILNLDKDFGMGYFFAVILEEAKPVE
jgi:hypothetical protein